MGWSVSEFVPTIRDNRIVPKKIIKRRQRRFVYVQPEENAAPELRLLTKENMLTGIKLPEKKFIVHRCNPEDDNPYGTGLGLQLYWPVFFKRKGIIAWNKLNDRFGSPTPGASTRVTLAQRRNRHFSMRCARSATMAWS